MRNPWKYGILYAWTTMRKHTFWSVRFRISRQRVVVTTGAGRFLHRTELSEVHKRASGGKKRKKHDPDHLLNAGSNDASTEVKTDCVVRVVSSCGRREKRTRLHVRHYARLETRPADKKLDTMARITINITYGQRLCTASRRSARTTGRPVTLRSRLVAVARGFVLTRKYNLKTTFPVGKNGWKSCDYTVETRHVPDVLVWLCFGPNDGRFSPETSNSTRVYGRTPDE